MGMLIHMALLVPGEKHHVEDNDKVERMRSFGGIGHDSAMQGKLPANRPMACLP